jgi:hypothetical protein
MTLPAFDVSIFSPDYKCNAGRERTEQKTREASAGLR